MRRTRILWAIGLLGVVAGAWGCQTAKEPAAPAKPAQAGTLDRTVLPIPEPSYPAITELDARKATPPPRFEVKAPTGAPNVVIVLIDDFGFGHGSAFGGPVALAGGVQQSAGDSPPLLDDRLRELTAGESQQPQPEPRVRRRRFEGEPRHGGRHRQPAVPTALGS